jgi:hypothetical protein
MRVHVGKDQDEQDGEEGYVASMIHRILQHPVHPVIPSKNMLPDL